MTQRTRAGVMGEVPGVFYKLCDGRVGLAGGRSGSVKKLFVSLVLMTPGLRRDQPGLRRPALSAGTPGAHGSVRHVLEFSRKVVRLTGAPTLSEFARLLLRQTSEFARPAVRPAKYLHAL